jgi:cell division inhibitor SulA
MMDTKVGSSKKDDPSDVVRRGFEAMLKGQGDVVTGWLNELQAANRKDYANELPRRAASENGTATNG